MEYSNPNISYITYIQNITPLAFIETFEELEHIEGFGICERFGAKIILNITDALTFFTAYSAYASQTAYAAYVAYESIVSQTAHVYLALNAYLTPYAAYAAYAYLIPLALLALLTLITLLITYKDTQYIEEEESEDESIELSDESHTEDEPKSEDESEDEPEDIDFTSSTIEGCIIVNKEGDIVSDNKSFRGILIDIWKTMEKEVIKETSTFTFKSGNKRGLKGYNWCEAINMSFQNKDSNKSLNEIRKMVEVNNLTIDLSIKLRTGEIVHID
jgi:hypothetical protein